MATARRRSRAAAVGGRGCRSCAVAWLAGWTISTFGIGVLIVLFFGGYDFSKSGTPTTVACVVQILLGLLLLVAAVRFWARRPACTGKLPKEPGWMTKIGKMSPCLGVPDRRVLDQHNACHRRRSRHAPRGALEPSVDRRIRHLHPRHAVGAGHADPLRVSHARACSRRAPPDPRVDRPKPGGGARGGRIRARDLACQPGHQRSPRLAGNHLVDPARREVRGRGSVRGFARMVGCDDLVSGYKWRCFLITGSLPWEVRPWPALFDRGPCRRRVEPLERRSG